MIIPLDVPSKYHKTFTQNYELITKKTDRLFLFAADHKMEHLDPVLPEHLFKLAAHPEIGAFATHPGLIARYGGHYPAVNFIAKLNGKTNLIPPQQKDPVSRALWSVEQVVTLQKNSGCAIRGVGYTIYLGSEFEEIMLKEAADIVYQAHQNGLIAILWIYPRGKSVQNETSSLSLLGATSVATSLGADFVKIKPPQGIEKAEQAKLLADVVKAAGNTKVIISGGERRDEKTFLSEIYQGLIIGNTSGAAVGRNIYEHDTARASKIIEALSMLIYQNSPLEKALDVVK